MLQVIEVGGTQPRKLMLGLIGAPKSGKTTLGAQICKEEDGLLVDVEQGADFVPFKVKAVRPTSWDELLILPMFADEFRTIVVDTLDACYDLLEVHIQAKLGVKEIKETPYGSGFAFARNELTDWLQALRRAFNLIVMLCHIRPGLDIESRKVDLPGKTGRAFVALVDAIGLLTVQNQQGRLIYSVSFDPSAGDFGSRIKSLHGKVLPADWKILKQHIFGSAKEQPERPPKQRQKDKQFEPQPVPDIESITEDLFGDYPLEEGEQ